MSSSVEIRYQFPDGTSSTLPTGLLISNQFIASADSSTFATQNPYTQEDICSVARAKPADIDKAVIAAREAWPAWRATKPQERGRLLLRLADLVERDIDVLAKIEAIDGGKAVKIARDADVGAAAACLRYYGGW